MPAVCHHCSKRSMYGRSHTHRRGVAGGRWKKRAQKTLRVFKANLQRATILEEGAKRQVKLCTKCIKRVKKDIADGKKPFLKIAHLEARKKKMKESVTVITTVNSKKEKIQENANNAKNNLIPAVEKKTSTKKRANVAKK